MNGLTWTRGELWPWLLLLPFAVAVAHLLLASSRRAARRYGALPTDAVASPLGRALRLGVILGLGFVCWLDPRYGEESLPIERRGLDDRSLRIKDIAVRDDLSLRLRRAA